MTMVPFHSVRSAAISALKNDAALTAIVPASRIWPAKTPDNPTFPFIRLDGFNALPLRFDCSDGGAEITGIAHCFTKISTSAPDPEERAGVIAGLICEALDALDDCHIESAQVIPDSAEPDAWHGVVQFRFDRP